MTANLTNTYKSGTDTILWDTTGISDGSYILAVRAYDTRAWSAPRPRCRSPRTGCRSAWTTPTTFRPRRSISTTHTIRTHKESDDSDWQKYEVHASTIAGFTPDASTLVATRTERSEITDRTAVRTRVTSLSAGTVYYFKVVSVDQASNSTPSNEVTATTPTSDGTTPDVAVIETEYDLANNITAVHDWLGVTTATYDALNRDSAITADSRHPRCLRPHGAVSVRRQRQSQRAHLP